MPTKHNKLRYKREEKPKKTIVLTGNCYLLYVDDEKIAAAAKGDLKLFASCKELHENYQGAYDYTGFTGFFRVDIFDGFAWHPLIITEFFPEREHYFSKHECPIDTYRICVESLEKFKGKTVARTYREHYDLLDDEA